MGFEAILSVPHREINNLLYFLKGKRFSRCQQQADDTLMQRYSSRDSHWPSETIPAGLSGLPDLQSSEASVLTAGSALWQTLFVEELP